MGGGSSRCDNFALYEGIKESLSRINEPDNSFNRFLISVNSIPKFTELIKEKNILENLENKKIIEDLEKDLNSKLQKYILEKNIIIYSKFEQCKNFIEDKRNEKENEFIIVDEKFLKAMKKEVEDKEKVKINIDKNKDMKIKFPDFEQDILFKMKQIGFYRFINKKYENINPNIDDSNFSININKIYYNSEINNLHNNINSQINSFFNSFRNHPLIYLENIENTSHINILLHCLVNIPNLTIYFSQKDNFNRIQNNDNKNKFSKAYSDIVYNIWKKDAESKKYSPKNLIDLIGDSNLFLPKNFIPFLFDKIHKELNVNNNGKNKEDIIESNETCAETEYYNFLESFDKNNKSIINETFYFEQLNKNKCKFCNLETFNFSMINKLEFNINEVLSNNKRENINLFDCFDYYIKIISNKCKKCNNEKVEIKIFNSLPNILTVILDFENNNGNAKFDVNYEIDLKNYLFNWNNYRKIESKYKLIGMMNFVKGNKECYLGYCKSPVDNKWYFYNNSSPNVVVINDIKENQGIPFILFYQKFNY